MANLQLSLTEAICARSRAEKTEYAVRDQRQPNLTLRVRPNGARSWIVRCRIDGQQHKATLGTYPEMSLKAARRAASSFTGKRPNAPQAQRAPRFSTFFREHQKRHGARYKPSGLVSYRTYVRNQLLPAFGRKRLDAIRRVDVVRWFETYSLTSPGGANRALGILAQMLKCAKAWGRLPDGWINPAADLRYNRRKPVGTFLSTEQMGQLGQVLSQQAEEGCPYSALLHVLALTGCRVGEMINLEWGDVLHDRLRLRDSKTGARDVPLGTSAYNHIEARRPALGAPATKAKSRVFTLPHKAPYDALRRVWKATKQNARLPPSLRIHDLRHSFASHAIMAGESLYTVSRLLGHSRVQTTARYAHLADDTLLCSAEAIGERILAQMIDHADQVKASGYAIAPKDDDKSPLPSPAQRSSPSGGDASNAAPGPVTASGGRS